MRRLNREYTKLDKDVSFMLMRTNPKLTTNVKLMYDGDKMSLESYSANDALSRSRYKAYRVTGANTYDYDIHKFYGELNKEFAFDVFQNFSDLTITKDYNNQYETFYWSGVESIYSKQYSQELGIVAPLYLKKKLPNYFIVFKVPGPSNYNFNKGDNEDLEFNFSDDILKNISIVKSFDLGEESKLGKYIRKYMSQTTYPTAPMYVDFSEKVITYYGIDYEQGGFTTKKESFDESLTKNDLTISAMDSWLTDGFRRNGVIEHNILNLEFLFDDNETGEYKFARYFGMYCDAIDEYEFRINPSRFVGIDFEDSTYCINNRVLELKKPNDESYMKIYTDYNVSIDDKDDAPDYGVCKYGSKELIGHIPYVKNKNNELFKLQALNDSSYFDIEDNFFRPQYFSVTNNSFNVNDIAGIKKETTYAWAERLYEYSYSSIELELTNTPSPGSCLRFYNIMGADFVLDDDEFVKDKETEYKICEIFASDKYDAGHYEYNMFSNKGTLSDIASAIAGCLNSLVDDMRWVKGVYKNNRLCIYSRFTGSYFDDYLILNFLGGSKKCFNVITSGGTYYYKNRFDGINYKFAGGTDSDKTTIKIKSEDLELFANNRYVKTKKGNVCRIISTCPYIDIHNENIYHEELDEYDVVILENEDFSISKSNQIEICDTFYPRIGRLSFYPVKDFNMDTRYSRYGDTIMNDIEKEAIISYTSSTNNKK